MGAVSEVVVSPVFDNLSAWRLLVKRCSMRHSARAGPLKLLPEAVLHWLAWRDVMPLDNLVPAAIWGWRTRSLGSVSDTIIPG